MKVMAAARTDIGLVRDHNEDAYLVEGSLFGVADGMGGHIAGDVASETAVSIISEQWRRQNGMDPDVIAGIVKGANSAIWEKAQDDPALHGMGTTCTMLVTDGSRGHIAHVGDSRAYLLRDGEMSQVTEDHTVVGRMVQEGKLRPDEAERHPHRNIITRALGVDEDVEVDTITLDLSAGDRFLLCSDGLSSMVGPGAIRDILLEQSDPDAAADRLIELAKGAGGDDNITVVVVDVVEEGTDPAVAPVAATRDSAPQQPEPAPAAPRQERARPPRRRRRGRRIGLWVLVLLVLAALAYAGGRYALANSWYVGVGDDGFVTIFQGIPEEVGGMNLGEPEEKTPIRVDDLPEFRRRDVTEGIKVDSRAAAEATVQNLEREATSRATAGVGSETSG